MTKRYGWIVLLVAVLAGGAMALWSTSGDRGPAADILNLADLLASNHEFQFHKEAESVARKHPKLGPVMSLFRLRTDKGAGLGVGEESEAIEPDGIEAMIKSLAKKGPCATDLAEQRNALVRMTQITAAIAEVAKYECEVKKKVGILDPADWRRWLEGVQNSSRELARAVERSDGAGVKEAAVSLNRGCTSCHRVFRE